VNYPDRVNVLQKRVIQEPDNVNLLNDYAMALMEDNKYEEALLQFENAVKIKPNIQSLHNLAFFYYTEGEPLGDGCWRYKEQEAITILESVVQHKPTSYIPFTLLGEIYTSKGNYDRSIDLLLISISIQPTFENLNNLGVCYYKKSMWIQAAECFKKAYSMRKKDDIVLHPLLGYGICLAKLGQREEAVKIANKLLLQNQKIESLIDKLEDQIAFIFYLTEHFNDFVNIYSTLNLFNYTADWLPPYFYSLWKLCELNKMEKVSENLIRHKENEIQEVLEEDDTDWEPGRKVEFINELKSDIDFIKTTVKKINSGIRPNLHFDPNIETRCYLFGCRRHNNPTYISF
jgi:tetratricopeptide (TPR) repeat protein